MAASVIKYREGYEYQLHESYSLAVAVKPERFILTAYIRLDTDGTLYIKDGYAWDGPSGPTFHTKSFMRGSLIHDALYQLMRGGWLDAARWRKVADEELIRICAEDGMWRVRQWWVYQGVRFGGGPAAELQDDEILTAP